jgi:hypothetical protein
LETKKELDLMGEVSFFLWRKATYKREIITKHRYSPVEPLEISKDILPKRQASNPKYG